MSKNSKEITDRMVFRLTEYLRILKEISKTQDNIFSMDIADKMNSTSAQVRQDLAKFGQFGIRGKGYNVYKLIDQIEYILGIHEENQIILVGYGKMGNMLASNAAVLGKSFKICQIFDKSEEKIGQKIENLDLEVKNIDEIGEYINKTNIRQIILSVTYQEAQNITDKLVSLGINAILNLTAYKLQVPCDVVVIDVDISSKLQELNFWRNKIEKDRSK